LQPFPDFVQVEPWMQSPLSPDGHELVPQPPVHVTWQAHELEQSTLSHALFPVQTTVHASSLHVTSPHA
jgi:hypothetical protein